jgi:hypothetical protein
MAHGVRQIVWGGLLLAVAAEVAGAVEGQPPGLSAPVALGVGGEDQRLTVAPVEVAFERTWLWAHGLDAFHMMCHRKHIKFGGSRSECQLGDLRLRLPAALHPRAQLVGTCACRP